MGRIGLTRRGGAFVASAVACFVAASALSLPALLYAAGLLFGLVLFAFCFVGMGPRRVTVTRTFTPAVTEPGRPVKVRLTVTNDSAVTVPDAAWSDRLPAVFAGHAAGTMPQVAAGGRVAVSYTVSSLARGHHEIGPLRLHVRDPFGLVRRTRTFGDCHRLTVLPHRFALSADAAPAAGDVGATRPIPQNIGAGEDDVIARPYLPGDAMKRLHWKATAHRGELMVRQTEEVLSPRTSVVLDLAAATHETRTLEWCVSAAASVVTHLVTLGHTVWLTTPDHEVDRMVGDDAEGLAEAMLALAGCEVSDDSDRPLRIDRNALLIAGRLSEARAGAWAEALRGAASVRVMVAATTPSAAIDRLERAGWRVVTYHPRSDIPDVWAAAGEGRHDAAR